jgi:hydrogenase/urease accessory protein HupE
MRIARVRPLHLAASIITLALAFAGAARAHDPGLSTARLVFVEGTLRLSLTFARRDVDVLPSPVDTHLPALDTGRSSDLQTRLAALAVEGIVVRLDGRRVQSQHVMVELDEANNVELRLAFEAAGASRITLDEPLLRDLPFGHRQILQLFDAQGAIVDERMLGAAESSFDASVAAPSDSPSTLGRFQSFLLHGVRHILEGSDHLLFLLGILLVTPTFLSATKVISCFSVAHSLTLSAVALGSLRVPAPVIEPLIAASVAYVGVENLVRRGRVTHRGFLTFAFGLVHGLGFATALREMRVGSGTDMILPLFSFNLGVELGQTAIAAIALPAIFLLRRDLRFVGAWSPACSVFVALAGGYWVIDRTFGL